MLVMQDSLRHATPQTAHAQYVPTSSDGMSFYYLLVIGKRFQNSTINVDPSYRQI